MHCDPKSAAPLVQDVNKVMLFAFACFQRRIAQDQPSTGSKNHGGRVGLELTTTTTTTRL